jgi:L-lactate dehydrogenase complex protein LldG
MPRDTVLGAVRTALLDLGPSRPVYTVPSAGAEPRTDGATLVARFIRQARAVGTLVHETRSQSEATSVLATILAEVDAERIVAWPTPLSRTVALAAARDVQLAEPGIAVATVADADVGITEADALVAASGTLVLCARTGARVVSLLPRTHVAIAPTTRLVADLATALRQTRAGDDAPDTCVTLITGPSRTADIEKKLVVGVHGPCALHVILLDDTEG